MTYSHLHIKDAFHGKLIGSQKMQQHVVEVLALMPQEVVDYVTVNVWFMASMEDAWAFTFTGSDLQNKHLIFLSDELLTESTQQIQWTIAHEIGHVMLKHKNRFFDKFSQKRIALQEEEADSFAATYLTYTL